MKADLITKQERYDTGMTLVMTLVGFYIMANLLIYLHLITAVYVFEMAFIFSDYANPNRFIRQLYMLSLRDFLGINKGQRTIHI